MKKSPFTDIMVEIDGHAQIHLAKDSWWGTDNRKHVRTLCGIQTPHYFEVGLVADKNSCIDCERIKSAQTEG